MLDKINALFAVIGAAIAALAASVQWTPLYVLAPALTFGAFLIIFRQVKSLFDTAPSDEIGDEKSKNIARSAERLSRRLRHAFIYGLTITFTVFVGLSIATFNVPTLLAGKIHESINPGLATSRLTPTLDYDAQPARRIRTHSPSDPNNFAIVSNYPSGDALKKGGAFKAFDVRTVLEIIFETVHDALRTVAAMFMFATLMSIILIFVVDRVCYTNNFTLK